MPNRRYHRLLRLPSRFQSMVEQFVAWLTARVTTPIRHCALFAKRCQKSAMLLIVSVPCGRNPTAVVGMIRAVIVDPINLQVIGITIRQRPVAKSEVRQKPFPTDNNAAPTIVGIIGRIGIETPGSHALPDSMRAGPRFAMPTACNTCRCRRSLSMKASATESVARTKVIDPRRRFRATTATAHRHEFGIPGSPLDVGLGDDDQATELIANVRWWQMRPSSRLVGHSESPNQIRGVAPGTVSAVAGLSLA